MNLRNPVQYRRPARLEHDEQAEKKVASRDGFLATGTR